MGTPNVADTMLKTRYGEFRLYVFSWSENEQDNVLVLRREFSDIPLVRIQSACYTGEIFDSLDCDCHWQLENSLSSIQSVGGLFIYMLCDGRGAGLLAKIRGMALSANAGLDTAEAYEALGVPLDPRRYERVTEILRYFSISRVRLMTNNPRKVAGLEKEGFSVDRLALESEPTTENQAYLRAKARKLGHMLVHPKLGGM